MDVPAPSSRPEKTGTARERSEETTSRGRGDETSKEDCTTRETVLLARERDFADKREYDRGDGAADRDSQSKPRADLYACETPE
jgi:hypothetical protein